MTEEERRTLQEARHLIAQGWCQGAYAKNDQGVSCDPCVKEATSFCIRGAIFRAVKPEAPEMYHHLCEVVERKLKEGLATFNDDPYTTQQRVLVVFDKVLEIPS